VNRVYPVILSKELPSISALQCIKVPNRAAFTRLQVSYQYFREAAMKACPTCDLVYSYELLQFCRFDGTPLVNTYSGEDTTQQLLPPLQILSQNTGALVDHRTGDLRNAEQARNRAR